MKKLISLLLALSVPAMVFTACAQQKSDEAEVEITGITLSDSGVLVGGNPASTDPSSAVYVSNDIVFYLEGQGADYGEGEADDGHSQAEADSHTVINITQPGHYVVTGSISKGQIAVNLGKGAKKNPDAVVDIVLNDADITCTVAPAIVCYKAYECGDDGTDTATKDVDTSAAGFNITLADGSVNNITGSHVAKIYEPGTTDKLHKYDAAIESMVSMNIYGTDGVLNLTSDNEGIETKLHMTVHGGEININSADDALNAGEDGVSVITINDGTVLANSNNGKEGDGIDSNGWLVINGGSVSAFGNRNSMDSGLDSDNGIYINGGTVFSTGNMYDNVAAGSRQTFTVLGFGTAVETDRCVVLVSSQGENFTALHSVAGGTNWVYSSPALVPDRYTVYKTDSVEGTAVNGVYKDITATGTLTQLGHLGGNIAGRPAMKGQAPENMPQGNMPQGEIPQGNMPQGEMPQGEMPQGNMPQGEIAQGNMPQGEIPQGNMPPAGMKPENMMPEGRPEKPADNNMQPPQGFAPPQHTGGVAQIIGVLQPVFTVEKGANMFMGITEYTE